MNEKQESVFLAQKELIERLEETIRAHGESLAIALVVFPILRKEWSIKWGMGGYVVSNKKGEIIDFEESSFLLKMERDATRVIPESIASAVPFSSIYALLDCIPHERQERIEKGNDWR